MSASTGIEWCDATFNPWWGCEKVSPGCAHCYADTLAARYAAGQALWGAGHGFRFFGDRHWQEPLRWARTMPAKLGRRPRVFCASMADVFEERDELEEPRARLFGLIAATPQLDWLILTKRPEFARDTLTSDDFAEEIVGLGGWPLPNVWLGVSIENARHTWRADVLREIPAAVRFISAEPLLGSLYPEGREPYQDGAGPRMPLDLTGIDWVIVGGESGPGARPMHPDWARELRDACQAEGVAFFFKQWGEWAPETRHADYAYVQQYPARAFRDFGTAQVALIGKKRAGRLLDGREWDEFPERQLAPVGASAAPASKHTNGEGH